MRKTPIPNPHPPLPTLHPLLPTPQQLILLIMPRQNHQRPNHRYQPSTRPQEGAKPRHPTPQFIKERRVVNYDHLPRPNVSIHPDGTLSDRIGWVLLHPDLHNHVRLRTSEIPYAEVYIELYRSFGKMAIMHNKVMNYILESQGGTEQKAQALVSAEEAYNDCISAATQLMDKVFNVGRWAHALWDILPYKDQHNPKTERQPLPEPSRISTGLISPHEGPSSTQIKPKITLVTIPLESQFLAEPTTDKNVEEQNQVANNPPYPAEEDTHKVDEMVERLELALEEDNSSSDSASVTSSTKRDWEAHVAELLARQHDSSSSEDTSLSSLSSEYSMSPQSPNLHNHHLEPTPRPHICFPIGHCGHTISTGDYPWRIVRTKPDGSTVYAHRNGFPTGWTEKRIEDAITHAIPSLPIHSRGMLRARLTIEDSLARWANISSTLVTPNIQGWQLNMPYRICIDESPEDGEKWNLVRTNYSADEVVEATLHILRTQSPLLHCSQGAYRFIDDIFDLDELHQLACDLDNALDKGLEERSYLAAHNVLDYWIIRRSDGQMMVLDNPSKALEVLVYSITTPQPSRRLYALCHMNRNLPDDEDWNKHCKNIIHYRNYLKNTGQTDKGGLLWMWNYYGWDNLRREEGGNVTNA